MTIQDLVNSYHSNRKNYLKASYNETQLRADFLDPLFELLGWDIKNTIGKPTNEREVLLEEALKANIAENSKKPDYTFRLFSERKFFLEAKKPNVLVDSNINCAKQVRRYGFTARLKISVLSNFEHLLIYDCSVKVDENDNHSKALVKKYHYSEYVEKFDELKKLLGKDAIYGGSFDEEWKDIEEKLNRFSIDNLFLNQINQWRKQLGAEIHKHYPRIFESLLNDYVQSYINRIIFLRVCEDRNLEEYQTLLQFADKKDFKALVKKFEKADKKYNSGLFDQFLSEKIIGNISSVFWEIIKQLYYPESPYSFAVLSSDVLGSIYEIFLSEKLVVKDKKIELVRKPENVDRDIITTPNYIIKSILNQTVVPFCEGKTDQDIFASKFADISCGSGAFLLEVFQLLCDSLVDYYLLNDDSILIQTNVNTYKLPFRLKRELLLHCIYGTDKDFNAVEATKFGLLLKLLENEDNNSININNPILPDLYENIHFGNTLLSPQQVQDEIYSKVNPFDFAKERYDVIVGNPPYMKPEDMKNITPFEFPLYKKTYTTAFKQFDKYFLFIERGLELLKKNGILGYIVPSKFMKVGSGKKLRSLLAEKKQLHTIVAFGANQVFEDKTTYTCLLFLHKKPQKAFRYTKVRNLDRFKLEKPDDMEFALKSTEELDDKVWVLLPPELAETYEKIKAQSTPLEKLVGEKNIFNGIQTSATHIYIHWILDEDKNHYFFKKDEEIWKVEKELTRPYYQTSRNNDKLYAYRPFKPNSFVIYPYKKKNGNIELVPIDDLRSNYPNTYKYLLNYKEKLIKRDIQPVPKTENEWYRYGRHQSLDKCEVSAKIVVGILSQNDGYAIDYHQTVLSSGGNAGYCIISYDEEKPYSIYYLQAILNSKYVEWACSLIGSVFRGGYISHGTQVLKKLPIRIIDFKNPDEKKLHDEIAQKQKELIDIYEQIDANTENKRKLIPLKTRFAREKNHLEELLAKLYDLGSDDSKIPLIKELYETD